MSTKREKTYAATDTPSDDELDSSSGLDSPNAEEADDRGLRGQAGEDEESYSMDEPFLLLKPNQPVVGWKWEQDDIPEHSRCTLIDGDSLLLKAMRDEWLSEETKTATTNPMMNWSDTKSLALVLAVENLLCTLGRGQHIRVVFVQEFESMWRGSIARCVRRLLLQHLHLVVSRRAVVATDNSTDVEAKTARPASHTPAATQIEMLVLSRYQNEMHRQVIRMNAECAFLGALMHAPTVRDAYQRLPVDMSQLSQNMRWLLYQWSSWMPGLTMMSVEFCDFSHKAVPDTFHLVPVYHRPKHNVYNKSVKLLRLPAVLTNTPQEVIQGKENRQAQHEQYERQYHLCQQIVHVLTEHKLAPVVSSLCSAAALAYYITDGGKAMSSSEMLAVVAYAVLIDKVTVHDRSRVQCSVTPDACAVLERVSENLACCCEAAAAEAGGDGRGAAAATGGGGSSPDWSPADVIDVPLLQWTLSKPVHVLLADAKVSHVWQLLRKDVHALLRALLQSQHPQPTLKTEQQDAAATASQQTSQGSVQCLASTLLQQLPKPADPRRVVFCVSKLKWPVLNGALHQAHSWFVATRERHHKLATADLPFGAFARGYEGPFEELTHWHNDISLERAKAAAQQRAKDSQRDMHIIARRERLQRGRQALQQQLGYNHIAMQHNQEEAQTRVTTAYKALTSVEKATLREQKTAHFFRNFADSLQTPPPSCTHMVVTTGPQTSRGGGTQNADPVADADADADAVGIADKKRNTQKGVKKGGGGGVGGGGGGGKKNRGKVKKGGGDVREQRARAQEEEKKQKVKKTIKHGMEVAEREHGTDLGLRADSLRHVLDGLAQGGHELFQGYKQCLSWAMKDYSALRTVWQRPGHSWLDLHRKVPELAKACARVMSIAQGILVRFEPILTAAELATVQRVYRTLGTPLRKRGAASEAEDADMTAEVLCDFMLTECGPDLPRDMGATVDPRVSFMPDAWQRRVLDAVDQRRSVLVVAPTSAGKSFASMYVVRTTFGNAASEEWGEAGADAGAGTGAERVDRDGVSAKPMSKNQLKRLEKEQKSKHKNKDQAKGNGKKQQKTHADTADSKRHKSTGGTVSHGIVAQSSTAELSSPHAHPQSHRARRVVVFVLPTRALVNQTYAMVSKQLGTNLVAGLFTRDYQVKAAECDVLVTVPQALDIFLLAPNMHQWRQSVRYIVVDEVHGIGSPQNSGVWERVVTLLPCPLLALSATVGQPGLFADWLSAVRTAAGHGPVELIQTQRRWADIHMYNMTARVLQPIHPLSLAAGLNLSAPAPHDRTPLESATRPSVDLAPRDIAALHAASAAVGPAGAVAEVPALSFSLTSSSKPYITRQSADELGGELWKWAQQLPAAEQGRVLANVHKHSTVPYLDVRQWAEEGDLTRRVTDTVRRLHEQQWTPALVFHMSRVGCERIAHTLAKEFGGMFPSLDEANFTKEEEFFWERARPYGDLLKLLRVGIGFHHSSMSRAERAVVEVLFRAGKLQVVVATATLAQGINMPCRTAVVAGRNRYLNPLLFRQLIGRAGRRGFDLVGRVVLVGLSRADVQRLVIQPLQPLTGAAQVNASLVLRMSISALSRDNRRYASDVLRLITAHSFRAHSLEHLVGIDPSLPQDTHTRRVLLQWGAEQRTLLLLEYLLRVGLMDAAGKPIGLAGFASHVYYHEPANFLLSWLLNRGALVELCRDFRRHKDTTARELMAVLCHFVNVRLAPPDWPTGPSVVTLPPLPRAVQVALDEHEGLCTSLVEDWCCCSRTVNEYRAIIESAAPAVVTPASAVTEDQEEKGQPQEKSATGSRSITAELPLSKMSFLLTAAATSVKAESQSLAFFDGTAVRSATNATAAAPPTATAAEVKDSGISAASNAASDSVSDEEWEAALGSDNDDDDADDVSAAASGWMLDPIATLQHPLHGRLPQQQSRGPATVAFHDSPVARVILGDTGTCLPTMAHHYHQRRRLNAYALDFLKHGQKSALVWQNGLAYNDLYELLKDWMLTLLAFANALQQITADNEACTEGQRQVVATFEHLANLFRRVFRGEATK